MRTATTDVPVTDNLSARRALRHELVNRLLADIFEGRLPAGTHLIVMNLTQRFGLSSTPVREALLELESIGVVQFSHNRGAVVKPFGEGQLREIFQIRRILEVEATRCACGRIDVAELQQIKEESLALEGPRRGKSWLEQEMTTDRKFHNMIAARCGSLRLEVEIHRYDALVQSMRNVIGNKDRLPRLAIQEHLAIIDTLMAGNAEAAAAAMGKHINRAAESIVATMFRGAPSSKS